MHTTEVSIRAALGRIKRKLARKNWRICTSNRRERSNVGRWHIVDDSNIVRDCWETVEQLTDYARDLGVMLRNEIITE